MQKDATLLIKTSRDSQLRLQVHTQYCYKSVSSHYHRLLSELFPAAKQANVVVAFLGLDQTQEVFHKK